MGWVTVVEAPHQCAHPVEAAIYGVYPGSIWKCDQCKTKWKLIAEDRVTDVLTWQLVK